MFLVVMVDSKFSDQWTLTIVNIFCLRLPFMNHTVVRRVMKIVFKFLNNHTGLRNLFFHCPRHALVVMVDSHFSDHWTVAIVISLWRRLFFIEHCNIKGYENIFLILS